MEWKRGNQYLRKTNVIYVFMLSLSDITLFHLPIPNAPPPLSCIADQSLGFSILTSYPYELSLPLYSVA